MSRMKVCHLTTVHPVFDNRILLKECASLAAAGYEVVLLAPNADNQHYKDVSILSVPIPQSRLLRMTLGVLRMLLAAIRQKARIYHFHDPELMPAGLILRALGKIVIADVHENYPASIRSKPYLNPFVARLLSMAFRGIEYSFLAGMNAVVTATDGISSGFRRLKPLTIHNYPIVPDLASIEPAQVPGSKAGVIYVGGLSRIRGIIELINAFGELDEAELWLLGTFETESFRAECEALPGWCNVRYLGTSSPSEVYSYLKAARIGIVTLLPVPNYVTALATKTFEYMATGLPVIMSDFPFWKQYFGDSAVYVDPADSAAISDAVSKLLTDPDLMTAMSAAGIRKSQEMFRWDREAEKLLTLYRQLTNNTKR